MSRLKSRRGAGLAEMMVALALAAVASAAGATALAGAERYVRTARGASAARRTLREAEAVLASELRAAPADSLRVRGDTAVDFLGLVGVSVICVLSGEVLVLPPDAAAGGFPYSTWRAAPEAGDILAAFDTSAGVWRTAVVDTASTRTDGAGCEPSSGLISAVDSAARRPVTRVVLRSSLAPGATVGSPVRVVRSARYALTKAADGSWSLSYRRCTGSSCGVAQPVVGPLAAPGDSGLVFADAAAGTLVDVSLRTPAPRPGASRESAVMHVALRNHATGVP
jgi:type II secretory pathway pseudopilin PulG